MDDLDDAILAKITQFIPPMDVLTSTCYVAKRFANVAQSDAFWKDHPLLQPSHGTTATFASPLSKHQRQRICLFRNCTDVDSLPSSLSYGSLFVSHTEAVGMLSTRRLVCAASTTDTWRETVENLLLSEDEDVFQQTVVNQYNGFAQLFWGGAADPERPVRWWCSAPRSAESIDTLLFATKCPLALMTKLLIKPGRDPFAVNGRVHNAKRLVVTAYRLPLHLLTNDVNVNLLAGFPCSFASPRERRQYDVASQTPGEPDTETIDRLLHGQTPVYVSSEEMELNADSDAVIQYNFPLAGVVANVVTLALIGKNYEQFPGRGYLLRSPTEEGMLTYNSYWEKSSLDQPHDELSDNPIDYLHE